jgi:hypothetical protein
MKREAPGGRLKALRFAELSLLTKHISSRVGMAAPTHWAIADESLECTTLMGVSSAERAATPGITLLLVKQRMFSQLPILTALRWATTSRHLLPSARLHRAPFSHDLRWELCALSQNLQTPT